MTTDTKYNGWTNYETWCCALWMDNSEGTSDYFREVAQECYDQADADKTFTRLERASFDLADRIKQQHEDMAEEWMPDQASFFADMLNASLSSVNWQEIASHYIGEVEEEQAA